MIFEHLETILQQFGVRPTHIDALGNRDGFSGAAIWRCEAAAGALCLRAWPDSMTEGNLHFIHHMQQSAAELAFVPRVLPARDGKTWFAHQGQLWELTQWMPGAPDENQPPSSARVAAACEALAHIHLLWEHLHPRRDRCPALARRLDALRQWQGTASSLPALDRLGEQALRIVDRWIAQVQAELARWQCEEIPLQPCLCDIWRNHVLFEGDRVSGIIDYGEVKIDHVAVDLARLGGSMVEDDADGWQVGLSAYRRVRPLGDSDEILARMLDRTGAILGVANWLRWLHLERRVFDNREAAIRRLGVLVARLERW
jgi:homoserine kinase type II